MSAHTQDRRDDAKVVRHGVFLDILGLGILVIGKSGIGKSELALELVSRGHRLIADDAPEFHRSRDGSIIGTSPALLRNFLEVRGLGILDVRAMFGARAIKRKKRLDLIMQLVPYAPDGITAEDRLGGCRGNEALLGHEVPNIAVPVLPGHNLSVLVEAACRDHKLRQRGYVAAEVFASRHQQLMEQAAAEQAQAHNA